MGLYVEWNGGSFMASIKKVYILDHVPVLEHEYPQPLVPV